MNQIIRVFQSLPKTFYSVPFYRELVSSWKGVGLGFLLVISILNTGYLAFSLNEPMTAFLNEGGAFFESLPDLTITNGTLKAEGEMPIKLTLFKNYQDKPVYVVFDTNSAMPDPATLSKKMGDENILIMVHNDAIALYDAETKGIEIRTTEAMKDHKFDHAEWGKLWEQIQSFLTPVTLLTFGFALFILQVFFAFLGAIILFIIAPLFKVQTAFSGCMRLSSASKVPVAVLFLLLPPNLPIQVLVWFGFASFGLLANRATPQVTSNTN